LDASDLKKRIITGTILVVGLIFFLWIDHVLLLLFILTFVTLASNEYLKLWQLKDIHPHQLALLLPIYILTLLAYFEVQLLLPSFILLLFICLLSIIHFSAADTKQSFLVGAAAGLFGAVYLSILPITIIQLRNISFLVCLMPLVLTWLYDTFAYFVGSLLGKHHLAPKISPKKTWEGTLFAFPLTFPFVYLLSGMWYPEFNILDCIAITLGIGVLGTLGDLFESAMKREVGLKDTSKVFPGHGGFLDRIDSLIFNVPFFYFYLLFSR